jgi:hypothetical protein
VERRVKKINNNKQIVAYLSYFAGCMHFTQTNLYTKM